MDYKEIIKDLSINKNNLLNEALIFSQKYYEYAENAANATKQAQIEKNKLEIIKAEADLEIRQHPKRFELGSKPLEAAIKAAIIKHSKVKEQTRILFKAQHEETILAEARMAFYHRKKMIEVAAQLDLRLHFSEVNLSGDAKNKMFQETSQSIKKDLDLKRLDLKRKVSWPRERISRRNK